MALVDVYGEVSRSPESGIGKSEAASGPEEDIVW